MLTKCQENALYWLQNGYNVHLFGEGGTGKTYLINTYLETLSENELKKTIIAAPTGIAALNIGGVTLHRAFKIPIGPLGPKDNPTAKVSESLKTAERVIIDEISMCRFDAFEYVTKCIRLAEREYDKKIQVIVIGDMLQLPPVITDKDREALEKLWGRKIMNGFAYSAPLWKSYDFKNCYLDEIKRQANDLDLIENNNKARKGDKSCISWYNSLKNKKNSSAIHLCGKNKDAADMNQKEIKKFEKVTKYYADIEGQVNEADKAVPEVLEVAIGMKVMVVCNGESYSNGQIGEVVGVSRDEVEVQINQKVCTIKRNLWQIEDYVVEVVGGEPRLKKTTIGTYEQMPLKPAYAITIHKSQGQTYENVIIHPQCFAAGQLYVAISRCSTKKGLCFSSKIKEEWLISDIDSVKFYEELELAERKGEKVTKSNNIEKENANFGIQKVPEITEDVTRIIKEMELKIEELQKLIIEKDKEIERLKGKNPRNAGRKVADEKWIESFNMFIRLHESQKTINEIMEEMSISRATYFRYKKLYNETNTETTA